MSSFLRALLLVLFIAAGVGAVLIYAVSRRGLSARVEPTRAEAVLARTVRRLATPRAARAQQNPVPLTDAVLREAMEHFADHCASCHANNGSGDTSLGRGLYPRSPDMRAAATQQLPDGELFWIIENGIRLTGMPAWSTGTPEGERASWALVHFIRHLPKLTAEEASRMEELNPRSSEEWQDEEAARRFLQGGQ